MYDPPTLFIGWAMDLEIGYSQSQSQMTLLRRSRRRVVGCRAKLATCDIEMVGAGLSVGGCGCACGVLGVCFGGGGAFQMCV